MRKYVVLLLVSLFGGCTPMVYSVDIEYANKVCALNGGLNYIHLVFGISVICKNGAVFPGGKL